MSHGTPTFETPMNESTRKRLLDLHGRLLRLHKVLLDDERVAYEREFGRVESSGQMLNLVMFDPHFDWLHAISKMIVRIDELTEDDETTLDAAIQLIANARELIQSTPESDFGKRYRAVLQREPGAVLAHAELMRSLVTDA